MPAKKSKSKSTKSIKPRIMHKQIIIMFIIFVLGFFTHLLVSVILASNSDDQIHACVNKQNGETRIITNFRAYHDGQREKERKDNKIDKDGCRENEISLSWNKDISTDQQNNNQSSKSNIIICPECNIDQLAGNRLKGQDLSNSILYFSTFINSDLSNAVFINANLEKTDFKEANLTNVNFTNANTRGAIFTNAKLDGAKWDNTTCPDGTNSNEHNNTCEGHFLAE